MALRGNISSADNTGGACRQKLERGDFKNPLDILMAVRYREETCSRCRQLNTDLVRPCSDLRDKEPSDSDLSSNVSGQTSTVSKTRSRLTTTCTPRKISSAAISRRLGKVSKAPKKCVINRKFVCKTLPKLLQKNVSDCNCLFTRSPWQHVLSPTEKTDLDITNKQGLDDRNSDNETFGRINEGPALQTKVYAQTKPRTSKLVRYSKLCRKGFRPAGYWESKFLKKSDVRAQPVQHKCGVLLHRRLTQWRIHTLYCHLFVRALFGGRIGLANAPFTLMENTSTTILESTGSVTMIAGRLSRQALVILNPWRFKHTWKCTDRETLELYYFLQGNFRCQFLLHCFYFHFFICFVDIVSYITVLGYQQAYVLC